MLGYSRFISIFRKVVITGIIKSNDSSIHYRYVNLRTVGDLETPSHGFSTFKFVPQGGNSIDFWTSRNFFSCHIDI